MIKNPYPGKFIAIEGVDGCGKSVQSQLVYDFLIQSGEKVLLTKEPAKYLPSGKLIYSLLFGKHEVKFANMTPRLRQRHYFINRIEHYDRTVIMALKSGVNVVTDRCFASVVFDVQRSGDLDILLSDEECYFEMAEVSFIRPDKIIILNLPSATAIKRLSEKDERRRDFFEQPEKIERTKEAYLEFANRFREFCVVVDGSPNQERVFADVRDVVRHEVEVEVWR